MNLTFRMSAVITLMASIAFCPAEAQQSSEAAMFRELREQIEILNDRINRPPKREHIRELQERIEILQRELSERPRPPRGVARRPILRNLPEEFRAPDRLERSVTLEFSGGGANASVTTARRTYQVAGHSSRDSHESGEIQSS